MVAGALPEVLDRVLERAPRAVMLSFGDSRALGASSPRERKRAATEHARSTFTLVREVADLLGERSPATLLCAAGGIADGRGLAAALVLGADGVLVGSRLWATPEANVPTGLHGAAIAADGDATTLSRSLDIARALSLPDRYSCRVQRNRGASPSAARP